MNKQIERAIRKELNLHKDTQIVVMYSERGGGDIILFRDEVTLKEIDYKGVKLCAFQTSDTTPHPHRVYKIKIPIEIGDFADLQAVVINWKHPRFVDIPKEFQKQFKIRNEKSRR